MFIETLEFTIPVELCTLFSTLQKGRLSNVEFPASVNSYGTTQDANIQVALRSNKLTFKVDGVSSNASMISKSECKTLKLSVFDVDRSLMPQDDDDYDYNTNASPVSQSIPQSANKRVHEQSVSLPPAKSSRTSYSDSPRPRSPGHRRSQAQSSPHPSELSQSRPPSDNSFNQSKEDSVNVKKEPEDPDLIEIEPDDFEPKKEVPFMQVEYSSNNPRVHTSHSQASSSFHQNVPHVQDYSEPGPSHSQHGDQSADDFVVFQDQGENNDDYDEDVDYGNDGFGSDLNVEHLDFSLLPMSAYEKNFDSSRQKRRRAGIGARSFRGTFGGHFQDKRSWPCAECGKVFGDPTSRKNHTRAEHDKLTFPCVCGKEYKYRTGLRKHKRNCSDFKLIKQEHI